LKIIQVVKRFGLCGGMEEYAFRLSEKLVDLGIKVKVLCEVQITETPKKVDVVQLGQCMKKPRWFSHVLFSNKVSKWVNNHACKSEIIHSHERISCHHVTTIHSTLFNFPKKGLPSFRKQMNEYLEKREMTSESVKEIVPVSVLIANEIKKKFRIPASKLCHPIPPGVSEIKVEKKIFNPEKPVIGFMGKEWKRKGLPKVIEIWREVRKQIAQTELCLAGFEPSKEIGLREQEKDKVKILGYVKDKASFYGKIDLLLHPAKKEAFGMVISEASSLGIPVFFSSECGVASDKRIDNGTSISVGAPTITWANSILANLNLCRTTCKSNPSDWLEVSRSYKNVYKRISKEWAH
jgi:UDP-glucose:(heptosyl)LPS alpha-1,3-glucosyltransferase